LENAPSSVRSILRIIALVGALGVGLLLFTYQYRYAAQLDRTIRLAAYYDDPVASPGDL
jgi:hypothetical protein